MKILILGGGRVGSTIADLLCSQRHDLCIVEKNPNTARRLDDTLDARVITGSATHVDVLFQAEVTSAEICLAVTDSDEVNLVGASIAKAMGVRRVAAHVYARSMHDASTLDYQRHFGVDRLVNIAALSAVEFANEIRKTGDLMIEHFAGGTVELQEFLIFEAPSAAMQYPLAELRFPPEVRVGTIRRGAETRIATAGDVIQEGDRISLVGNRNEIEKIKKRFRAISAKRQKVFIGGGGETGLELALVAQSRGHDVTIMDSDRARCHYLSGKLLKSTVIHGDATSRNALISERIENMDYFIACTGADEENIVAAIEAKDYNPKIQTMVLVNRPDYTILTDRLGIDKTINPASVIARQVMGFLNSGSIIFRNSQLIGRSIDVLELEVPKGAGITKDTLRAVSLPQQCLIAAVIRNGCVLTPSADFRFQTDDHAVALVQSDALAEMMQLF